MKNFFVLIILFFATACSNPFGDGNTAIDDGYGPDVRLPAPTSIGTISGSDLGGSTVNSKKVEISVGASTSKLKVTTSRNRTLFVSVQGQMISN